MKRAVVFNYNSRFVQDIEKVLRQYNSVNPDMAFLVDMFRFDNYSAESLAGRADVIIHSGGDGIPTKEDVKDIPKLYICFSHEWKAKKEGGKVGRLNGFIKGVHEIDVLKDDEILGKTGKMPIMKYHELAVIEPPPSADVLATSTAIDKGGKEIEIIEALKYPDGSISIQGHPEEGTAAHILYNFFNFAHTRIKRRVSVPAQGGGNHDACARYSKVDKETG